MNGSLRCVALAGLLALSATSGAVEPPVRQVLVLQTFDRGNLIVDHFTGNFRIDLEQRAGGPINFVQVVVGPTGFVGPPEQSVIDFIRSTFADRAKPDLIVTVAGPAAVFARKHRRELFPDTPLLFSAVDQSFLGNAPLGENEAAVAARNDFPGIVDDILQLRPETRQVFMISGSGDVGKFWRKRLEEQFGRFRGRVEFIWSDDLSLPEILGRCSTLPANSAIFFLTLGTDATGAAYADERVMADLHAAANAPIFSAHDVYLGTGIVGGRLMSIDELSHRTTDSAFRILRGEAPSEVRLPAQLPGQPMFDWRELKRWRIAESRLPAGSLVQFRGPNLWNEHRGTVLAAAAVLAIQAVLIVGLLLERRARRRAEIESRRNLALAADVSRRETMSALGSSIEHELVQPLSAMLNNAEALRMLVNSARASPEVIDEILKDIHADGIHAAQIIERHRKMLRSHQLEKKLLDLQVIVNDTVALVGYDMRARQIEVNVNRTAGSCVISGDPVLLQQVFVNLLMNAMDAMASIPQGRRQITISTEVRGAEVKVSVQDTGPGLPADLVGKVFTPFVTTKPSGLGIGLVIVKTIVEAHGGNIDARNHPEGGAVFTVTLRVSQDLAPEPIPVTAVR